MLIEMYNDMFLISQIIQALKRLKYIAVALLRKVERQSQMTLPIL
jgi:hypothetical protein